MRNGRRANSSRTTAHSASLANMVVTHEDCDLKLYSANHWQVCVYVSSPSPSLLVSARRRKASENCGLIRTLTKGHDESFLFVMGFLQYHKGGNDITQTDSPLDRWHPYQWRGRRCRSSPVPVPEEVNRYRISGTSVVFHQF